MVQKNLTMTGLRKNLTMIDGIAMSLAAISPATITLAISLSAQSSIRAAPLTFLIAMITMIFVALAFCMMARKVVSAGSVFAYLSQLANPGLGFMGGWAMILCYITVGSTSSAIAGSTIARAFTKEDPPTILWISIAAGVLILSSLIACRSTKLATRLMLIISAICLIPLVYLSWTILHQLPSLSLVPFVPDHDVTISGIAYGVVVAIFAYTGFESASTLGEEISEPTRTIPIAMLGTTIVSGIFFVFTSYAQVLGYGLDHTNDLLQDLNPYHFLAIKFVSPGFATMVDFAVGLGASLASLASIIAAARILFALGRSGAGKPLGTVDPRYGTPVQATLFVFMACLLGLLFWGTLLGASKYNNYGGTVSALSFIVVYLAVMVVAAMIAIRLHKKVLVLTCLTGITALCWSFYASLFPVPEFPMNFFPYIVLLWLECGGVILFLKPSLSFSPSRESQGETLK